MNTDKLISIVVPIYNVEKYLKQCIDSITGQTYKNIEIILVDDKTPDSSGKIADNLAKNDKRIKVIHKSKNEGLNMARATGFEASLGEYIMFVDSDDVIARDCVEFSLQAILKNGADFVKFNSLTFSDTKTLPEELKSIDDGNEEKVVIGKKELFEARFNNSIVGVSRVTVWGGIYTRQSISLIDWRVSNYRQHEDVYWTMLFLKNANKGVFISRVGYFYRINDSNEHVLSKALSGNTYNGKPIGYLEFASNYSKELNDYNEKYDLQLHKEIDEFMAWQWIDRLSRLIEAKMLTSENNIEYLPDAIDAIIGKYQEMKRITSEQKEKIDALRNNKDELRKVRDELYRKIDELHDENKKLENELRSFLSIKRSAKMLLGNIKRKAKSIVR